MGILSNVIGSLVVRIGADTSGLDKGAAASIRTLGKIGAAALVAGAAIVTGLTKSSMSTIDTQAKLARQLGGTTAAVQTLQRQADLAGVSKEALAKSIQMLNARLGEAMRNGMSPAAQALDRLGLSAEALSKMDADDRLITIADRMKELGLNASQQADVLKELGIRSKEVFNMLEDGGDAIRRARQDVEDFGVAVSDVDAAQIEAANDAMTTIGMIAKGIGNQLAVHLAPAIKHIATMLSEAGKAGGGFGETIEWAVGRAVRVFGAFSNVWHQLRVEFDELVGDILDGINWIIRSWNKMADFLPKGTLKTYDEISHTWGKLRSEIGDPPTGEHWNAWWDEIKRKSKETAEAVVAAREAMTGADPSGDVGMTDADKKKAEREEARLASELERLRAHLMTKEEAEFASYQNQLTALDEFYNQRLVSDDEYHRMIEAAREQHEERIADIRDRAIQEELRARSDMANRVVSTMNALGNALSRDGEKNFGITKAISIATALIKGWEAVTSSYAAGAKIGGPPLGAAYAAMAAAQTAAQIASMRSVSSKGGGGSPKGGGAASVPEVAESGGGVSQGATLVLQGFDRSQLYGGDAIQQIAEGMVDFFQDGGSAKGKRVVFA